MEQVIVVEGRDDSRRLREVLGPVDTIETRGSALDQETLDLIAKAQAQRGVIVFTDPDYPGQRIRALIQEAVPGVGHAYLERDQAQSTKTGQSLGVEHASAQAIRQALEKAQFVQAGQGGTPLTQAQLVSLGLVGSPASARLRQALASRLGIGHVNGKQLAKRLSLFGIGLEAVKQALAEIEEEGLS